MKSPIDYIAEWASKGVKEDFALHRDVARATWHAVVAMSIIGLSAAAYYLAPIKEDVASLRTRFAAMEITMSGLKSGQDVILSILRPAQPWARTVATQDVHNPPCVDECPPDAHE